MVKGNQTQAASVAEESAKGIQKSSTRRAGERTTPQRCEPLGGMVDANVKLVMSVFWHLHPTIWLLGIPYKPT